MNLTVSFFVNGHLQESRQIVTPCTIGRSRHASWVLTHPLLSRTHCMLFEKEEELYISDSGSLNGTFVKGQSVAEPVRLQFGDEFTIGDDLLFRVSPPHEQSTDFARYAGHTTTINARNNMPYNAADADDDIEDDTDLVSGISPVK